jgi:hypothetical protein
MADDAHVDSPLPPRRSAFANVLLAVVAWSPIPVAWLAAPWIARDELTICSFRLLSGYSCPFCGLTRAFAAATHGNIVQATALNPLWPAFMLGLLVLGALLLIDAVARTQTASRLIRTATRHWLAIVFVLAGFGVLRAAIH